MAPGMEPCTTSPGKLDEFPAVKLFIVTTLPVILVIKVLAGKLLGVVKSDRGIPMYRFVAGLAVNVFTPLLKMASNVTSPGLAIVNSSFVKSALIEVFTVSTLPVISVIIVLVGILAGVVRSVITCPTARPAVLFTVRVLVVTPA